MQTDLGYYQKKVWQKSKEKETIQIRLFFLQNRKHSFAKLSIMDSLVF